jgi:SPP1 family predicted phage head-tail adaptor
MRGGALHNVITFEAPEEFRGPNNEPSVRWPKQGQAFCEVKTRNARKFTEAGQNYERQVHDFYCRYFDAVGVQQDWRIRFNGKLYKITGITPDHERLNWIKLETEFFNETSRS